MLTDTNREVSRPVVVLLTDAHRGTNEPEPGIALVNHCVPVAKVLTDHLPIHNLLRNAAVARCKVVQEKIK